RAHRLALDHPTVVCVSLLGARVRLVGAHARAATYEIRPNDTLAHALRYAGGFTATAARRRVQIERIVPPEQRALGGRDRIVTEIESNAFKAGTGPSDPVLDGDIIRVFSVVSRVRNRTYVRCDVWSPGSQGLTPCLRV